MNAGSILAGEVHRSVESAVGTSHNAQRAARADTGELIAVTGAVDSAELDRRERRGAAPSPTEEELARMHRHLKVRRYRSLLLHWLGRWFRRPRPTAPDPLAPVQAGEVAISFVGHASALLRYRGLAVAFDPMLGSWVGGVRRAVAPGLGSGDFRDVSLILISHRHSDHLHPETLAMMPKAATVVVPAGAAATVSPLGFARVIELRPGADFEFRGLKISTFPIQHGEGELASGLCYLLRGHGPSVFLCGDSAYHPGFATIGERFAPDIALLPIGGFWPRSFRERHMSPLDALAAFKDLTARALVPIHHGSFALSYEKVTEPIRLLLEVATARGLRDYVVAMEPGQTDTFALDAVAATEAQRAEAQELATPDAGDVRDADLAVREGDEPGEAEPSGGTGRGAGSGAGPLMAQRR